ncbi:hypothetical protein A2533_04985 [Candidatus Falkowbacteria bacterium RIFOXYD2_FULL_35_9]|uniref:DUF1653 domain-containing protein n=1 Tax=Candidatus Falkowbacteria bacterium RIFOXYC2_FULL_36_12 TaxID=1798002 RepID=A0A1F5SZX1_9BACT|nr:MAG: hypothetical protein A2478_02930 [Candidatus Falkowbacteria bacterium RIFOXYC2_FULL_36_12]OGF33870.1 MAG: hypothetical protein A2223_03070 [Candidatus Falkowbacteria bacterium RIFOXYA2_FULL_35_8]OGF46416.1 MAG: hypothetical protein A2533_04985 [Candidatus Falkowbacteria bacterium RIFOXYD2_FULL_35_9]
MDIKLGKYQHFKGKHYQVIGLAKNSETLEELVVYQALYPSTEFGDQAIWVRPKKMFADFVEVNNELIPRFKFIK